MQMARCGSLGSFYDEEDRYSSNLFGFGSRLLWFGSIWFHGLKFTKKQNADASVWFDPPFTEPLPIPYIAWLSSLILQQHKAVMWHP
jgi:hypothetical protein